MRTFWQSFYALKSYPAMARRSVWRTLLHFVALLVLMSTVYAAVATLSALQAMDEHLPAFLSQVPPIKIHEGRVSSPVEQPYVIPIEGKPFFVLDTLVEPRRHLQKSENGMMVLGGTSFLIQKPNGEIREYPLENLDAYIDEEVATECVDVVKLAMWPVFGAGVFLWQFFWKSLQVLFVAGLVTLAVGGRPGFGTNWKLAVLALAPAMAWGVLVFSLKSLAAVTIPMASMVFYGLLIGFTLSAARAMKADELRKQNLDFVPTSQE